MQPLRMAIRALRATPVVSQIVVLTLALGIGANTAIFSVVNSLLLRTWPVPAPGRLVTISADYALAHIFKAGVGWNDCRQCRLRHRSGGRAPHGLHPAGAVGWDGNAGADGGAHQCPSRGRTAGSAGAERFGGAQRGRSRPRVLVPAAAGVRRRVVCRRNASWPHWRDCLAAWRCCWQALGCTA
jgi:hypothetical protein